MPARRRIAELVLRAVQAAVEAVDAAADDDHGMGQAGVERGRIADQGIERQGPADRISGELGIAGRVGLGSS